MSDAAYWAEYRKRNREKLAAYQRSYRLTHGEEIRANHRRSYAKNREKYKAASKKWRDEHPKEVQNRRASPKAKEMERAGHVRRTFGITKVEYETMLSRQKRRCSICRSLFGEFNFPCVDHCHRNGNIRGLLCRTCNSGIGHLKDSVRLLKSAIKYLERTRHGQPAPTD
jgi:Recombination endonuclease VII